MELTVSKAGVEQYDVEKVKQMKAVGAMITTDADFMSALNTE